jgi:hypothetical protein
MQRINISLNVTGILIKYPLYLKDIEATVFLKLMEIHRVRKLMIGRWIDFEMTLLETSIFLDHLEHAELPCMRQCNEHIIPILLLFI